MLLRSLKLAQVKKKRVLLRIDFNVPIKNNRILDDSRIKAVLPTIKYLIKQKAKIILISHFGEPETQISADPASRDADKRRLKAQIDAIRKQFSLKPVYQYLKKIKFKINFVDDCIGSKVKEEVEKLKPGEMVLLENLRFYSGEKNNDPQFAKELASLADLYVNEAFSVCHRQHASVSAITKFLPSYAGFLLEKEVEVLSEVFQKPKHPFVLILGGAKISTKIGVIKNLAQRVDKILIGGTLANNFFAAQGLPISQSKYEPEMMTITKKLLRNRGLKNKLVLPIDVRIRFKIKDLRFKIKDLKIEDLKSINNQFQILDIGSETIKLFSRVIKFAKMIVWNGPIGYTEERQFSQGTDEIIKSIFANKKAKVIIGGGETIAALRQFRGLTRISLRGTRTGTEKLRVSPRLFVSMGGGAMLKFLEGKILPGLKPLLKGDSPQQS